MGGRVLDALIAERRSAPSDPGKPPRLPGAARKLGQARLGVDESAALYAGAEDGANALLERFPGSPLKAQAYAVLAGSAWDQHRYRTAAGYGAKAQAELTAGPARAQFGALVAEAWFRAGDYQNTADAYAAALRAPPEGIPLGRLMFQEVQSEIEARSWDAAGFRDGRTLARPRLRCGGPVGGGMEPGEGTRRCTGRPPPPTTV